MTGKAANDVISEKNCQDELWQSSMKSLQKLQRVQRNMSQTFQTVDFIWLPPQGAILMISVHF